MTAIKCPMCIIGDIINNKCNYCKAEFCSNCGGLVKTHVGLPKLSDICNCKAKNK